MLQSLPGLIQGWITFLLQLKLIYLEADWDPLTQSVCLLCSFTEWENTPRFDSNALHYVKYVKSLIIFDLYPKNIAAKRKQSDKRTTWKVNPLCMQFTTPFCSNNTPEAFQVIWSNVFSELHSALLFPNPFSLRAKLRMKMCVLDSAHCFCPGYLSCFERIKSTALSWDTSLRGRIKQCEICGFRAGRSAQSSSPRCLTWHQFNKIIHSAFIGVHGQSRRHA